MEKVQLIVVGYAGSEASNFNNLIRCMDSEIILSVVEYKGRGNRRKENYYKCCDEMVEDISKQIKKIRNYECPYAILGYSMGAQNVSELFARKLIKENPICVFIAAHEPPDVPCMAKRFSLNNDKEFLRNVKTYGGMDERLLMDERFARIYISRIKADFKLLQEYRFNSEYHIFPSQLIVFYCEVDTPYKLVQGWQRFASDKIHFYELGCSHFFFRTDTKKFCEIIRQELQNSCKKESHYE